MAGQSTGATWDPANPTLDIRSRGQNGGRKLVLAEPELVEVWNACGDDNFGHIVRLLKLTGQRKTEIGDLRWSEVDLDRRQIVLAEVRTKNARAYVVPLSDQACAIIKAVPPRQP
jgi:integrase